MNSARAIAAWSVRRQFLMINSVMVRFAKSASRSKKKPSLVRLLWLKFNERIVRLWSRHLARKATPCWVNWLDWKLIFDIAFCCAWCSSYWLNWEAMWDMPLSCKALERRSSKWRDWPHVRMRSLIRRESCTWRPERTDQRHQKAFGKEWNSLRTIITKVKFTYRRACTEILNKFLKNFPIQLTRFQV